ncbi:hypothetical protein PENTCL1PPCAC_21576, partial [Pristionchus entomophagus]
MFSSSGTKEQYPNGLWQNNRGFQYFYFPRVNIGCSCVGYLLFGLILLSCHKKGVLRKYMHDVLLILAFAWITDLLETAKHFYLLPHWHEDVTIYNEKGTGIEQHYWSRSTSLETCTLAGFWLTYLHYLITYVHAIVAYRRFLIDYRGQDVSVSTIYIGIGAVLGLNV